MSALQRVDVYCPGQGSFEVLRQGTRNQPTEYDPVAHVIVTLPMRFRGGVLSIAKDGNADNFWGRGTLSAGSSTEGSTGKTVGGGIGNVEWVAYMGNGECDYLRVDKVESGVRVQLVYDLCLRAFGPYGVCEYPPFLLASVHDADAISYSNTAVINAQRQPFKRTIERTKTVERHEAWLLPFKRVWGIASPCCARDDHPQSAPFSSLVYRQTLTPILNS